MVAVKDAQEVLSEKLINLHS